MWGAKVAEAGQSRMPEPPWHPIRLPFSHEICGPDGEGFIEITCSSAETEREVARVICELVNSAQDRWDQVLKAAACD